MCDNFLGLGLPITIIHINTTVEPFQLHLHDRTHELPSTLLHGALYYGGHACKQTIHMVTHAWYIMIPRATIVHASSFVVHARLKPSPQLQGMKAIKIITRFVHVLCNLWYVVAYAWGATIAYNKHICHHLGSHVQVHGQPHERGLTTAVAIQMQHDMCRMNWSTHATIILQYITCNGFTDCGFRTDATRWNVA